MPRKYVPNGRPNGGKREGAGRPPGTKDVLPRGSVKILKLAKLLPEDAAPELANFAGKAMDAVEKVLDGKLHHTDHSGYLKAAGMVLERVCGPVKQKVEHSFAEMTDEQLEERLRALRAKEAATFPVTVEVEAPKP